MADKAYTVASEEGVAFVSRFGLTAEIGDEVELDLKDAETAVLAAGWLEHADKKGKK